jgi:hypothetical protein
MTFCKFRVTRLEGHLAEIRLVLPLPNAVPCDLEGNEAAKRIAKWACSYVTGIAEALGLDAREFLYDLQTKASQNLDVVSILTKVRSGAFGPYDLELDPPEGLTPKATRIMVQKLLDQGILFLDDDLHLTVNQN